MSRIGTRRQTRRPADRSAGRSDGRAPVREPAPRVGREQRVLDILQAARAEFCAKGYEQALVSEIAAQVGVVEGTVYKYFATKRELLLKVLEHWYEEMFGDYARDLAGVEGSRQRLQLLIWRHLRTVRDYPQLCQLMFFEFRADRAYRGSELYAMNRRYTRFLTDVIEEGIAAGEFRDDLEPALLRDLVYGGIEHHAARYLGGEGELDIDRIARSIADVLCDGIVRRRTSETLRMEAQRLIALAEQIDKKSS